MTLVRRANSKFWYVQFQLKHITIIRSTRTSDRRVAERVAAKIRAEAHEKIVLGRKRSISLELALKQFVQHKESTPNHKNLKVHFRALLRYFKGSMPLAALSSNHIEGYAQSKLQQGIHPQTVKHNLNCLFAAIKKVAREGYEVPTLECPKLRIPKSKIRFITAFEEQRLLNELDPERLANGMALLIERKPEMKKALQDNFDLIVLLLDTGARYSEVANIKWSQIDLDKRAILLWRPKVRNESVIFMTDRVFDILSRRRSDAQSEFVFTNKQGKARGYQADAIRKAFRRAGLHDCTIHTLRHTHASRLIQNGLSVYEVRAVLGHTDIKTTMRYAHLEQTVVTQRARDVINQLNSIKPNMG